MSEPTVLSARRGDVLVLTLNRPERLNAWTVEMESRYFDLLSEADEDPGVRAIVVTGAGRGFCAGADMGTLKDLASGAATFPTRDRPFSHPLTIRKPIVAAIHGACAGIGLVQALYCDVRFVATDAKVTTAFTRRGLPAEYGISWLLPRLVGPARALDLLLSGRVVRGDEAAEVGLAQRAVPPDSIVDHALDYATDLADHCSPAAMAAVKQQVARDLEQGFAAAVEASEAIAARVRALPDFSEGVTSFVERRPAQFDGLAPLAATASSG